MVTTFLFSVAILLSSIGCGDAQTSNASNFSMGESCEALLDGIPIVAEELFEYVEDVEEGDESDHVDGEVLEDGEVTCRATKYKQRADSIFLSS